MSSEPSDDDPVPADSKVEREKGGLMKATAALLPQISFPLPSPPGDVTQNNGSRGGGAGPDPDTDPASPTTGTGELDMHSGIPPLPQP